MTVPTPPFSHLLRLGDETGIFEHALGTEPRRGHGYCTDDVARALVVLVREESSEVELSRLLERCLAFVEASQLPSGVFRNRRAADGTWRDSGGPDDTQGRALYGLAVTVARADVELARPALAAFRRGCGFRSPSPRANAAAVLAAAELLGARPEERAARKLLMHAATGIGRIGSSPEWPWPESRLAWGNALLPEARIAAGVGLGDDRLLQEGLDILDWLVDVESGPGYFSFTPVAGWARGEPRPAFDQQPIEAGTMADACARAFAVTGEQRFAEGTLRAARWFLGENDLGLPLLDRATGGCADGLTAGGVNLNEGAESTLALIGALQQAQRVEQALRAPSAA